MFLKINRIDKVLVRLNMKKEYSNYENQEQMKGHDNWHCRDKDYESIPWMTIYQNVGFAKMKWTDLRMKQATKTNQKKRRKTEYTYLWLVKRLSR